MLLWSKGEQSIQSILIHSDLSVLSPVQLVLPFPSSSSLSAISLIQNPKFLGNKYDVDGALPQTSKACAQQKDTVLYACLSVRHLRSFPQCNLRCISLTGGWALRIKSCL